MLIAAMVFSPAQAQTNAAPGTKPIANPDSVRALAASTGPRYNDKYEIFGGLSFMNGQAGQNLPTRYNMGGAEGQGTYWLGRRLGVAADYRFEAGTTPVVSPFFRRVLVYQNILAAGIQYRGPKNRYVAIDYHLFAGGAHGTFDHAITNYPSGTTQRPTTENVGLYSNSTTPWGAAGGSIDFNYSPRLAIRLSPDIIFEHYGTETREFVSVGGGVMYRFGHR